MVSRNAVENTMKKSLFVGVLWTSVKMTVQSSTSSKCDSKYVLNENRLQIVKQQHMTKINESIYVQSNFERVHFSFT